MIERDGYQIETDYECPPIAVRSHDWIASVKDGDYDYDWDGEGWVAMGHDPVGYGVSEEEAIQDLLEKLKERDDK